MLGVPDQGSVGALSASWALRAPERLTRPRAEGLASSIPKEKIAEKSGEGWPRRWDPPVDLRLEGRGGDEGQLLTRLKPPTGVRLTYSGTEP
jgi:hypothetical protein